MNRQEHSFGLELRYIICHTFDDVRHGILDFLQEVQFPFKSAQGFFALLLFNILLFADELASGLSWHRPPLLR